MEKADTQPRSDRGTRAKFEGLPALQLWRWMIIQQHDEVEEAFQAYEYRMARKLRARTSLMKVSLMRLFRKIRASYKYDASKKEYDDLISLLESNRYDDLREAFDQLDDFLYEKKVIRFDTRKKIDDTDMLAENEEELR